MNYDDIFRFLPFPSVLMFSEGLFRIGDYIWDWSSKQWVKCKEHHMDHMKHYYVTNNSDRKDW